MFTWTLVFWLGALSWFWGCGDFKSEINENIVASCGLSTINANTALQVWQLESFNPFAMDFNTSEFDAFSRLNF